MATAAPQTLPLPSPPASPAPAQRDEVSALARELFVSKVTHNATGGKLLNYVAQKCFEEAAAFLAVAAEYAKRTA